uniref:Uncharacterized protein n=1 Tax=Physcomitrium patens TaxID=3218 RepID=A0A7I4CXF9_PHYPA
MRELRCRQFVVALIERALLIVSWLMQLTMLWCELCPGFTSVGFFTVAFSDVIAILFLGTAMNTEDLIRLDVAFGWYRMMRRTRENMVVNVNGEQVLLGELHFMAHARFRRYV